MARRTEGERVQPAQAFARRLQAKQERNALAGLKAYRAAGGRIRTQDWYRIWRTTRDVPQPEQPERPRRRVAGTGGWITNVGVTYLDPRDNTLRTHWFQMRSGRNRMTDEEAIIAAIDQGDPTAEKYEWVAVDAYVTSYEPL